MPETSSGPSVAIAAAGGEPPRKRGRPPKAALYATAAPPPTPVVYQKHRKREVLLWLINHRFEDTNGQGANAAAGVEALPHKMPDGSEKWFRGPTFAEAAAFFGIPSPNTIARWWDLRDGIFDGAVPASVPPLVPPHRPWRMNNLSPAAAAAAAVTASSAVPIAAVPVSGPPVHSAAEPGGAHLPRLAPTATVYPQAVQPAGPPMHPLYRANFALGEVAREVSHMLQNQQNLYLENLLRAIAMSQALVNDLNEAHIVLLNPQSYPQYYPPAGGVAAQAQTQQQQQYYAPPPHPHSTPLPPPQHGLPAQTHRAHIQSPSFPPPSPSVMSRMSDGRYVAIQPSYQSPHPPTPGHAPRYHHQQQHQNSPQPGQQAGQHQWLIGNGAGTYSSNPASPAIQQPPQRPRSGPPSAATSNGEATFGRKRSYASRDGPGATASQPIELEEEEEDVQAAIRAHREKRRNLPNRGIGAGGQTIRAGSSDEEDELNGFQRFAPESSGTLRDENGRANSIAVAERTPNTDGDKDSAPPVAEQAKLSNDTSQPGPNESESGEAAADDEIAAQLENTDSRVDDEQHHSERPRKSDEVPEQGHCAVESGASDKEKRSQNDASSESATERGSEESGDGSRYAAAAAVRSGAEESGADDGADVPAETRHKQATALESEEVAETQKGEDTDMNDTPAEALPTETAEEEEVTETRQEDADMGDTPHEKHPTETDEQQSPSSIEE